MTLDASGNLLVGTTSGAYNGKIVSVAPSSVAALVLDAASGTNTGINFYNAGTIKWTTQVLTTGEYRWYDFTAGAERARIDIGGRLSVGATTAPYSALISASSSNQYGIACQQIAAGGHSFLSDTLSNAGTYYHFLFLDAGVARGSITSNGTIMIYGGTSDYRLKEITGPLTDSGKFIDALKPKVGTWKSNGDKFVGFIAHEFAEVFPSSVQGEKDAVDEDGKPKYQSMQASSAEVIANLVAELQSVRQRLAALETK
jgi:hypothetical protein